MIGITFLSGLQSGLAFTYLSIAVLIVLVALLALIGWSGEEN